MVAASLMLQLANFNVTGELEVLDALGVEAGSLAAGDSLVVFPCDEQAANNEAVKQLVNTMLKCFFIFNPPGM
ncbi:hypothetical protein GCM10008018_69400 [Paenibacillus marchantiophytorum]|uniref:Uncharacterized protein n=1 Tax=Paenibacillus marchantiophytorum TaxID=1619310 RepID=A0ABQ1FJ13_9BACL|nr:hypothetical protein GCM10008018_69400 [Paenibacillus marchantiophytorum]